MYCWKLKLISPLSFLSLDIKYLGHINMRQNSTTVRKLLSHHLAAQGTELVRPGEFLITQRGDPVRHSTALALMPHVGHGGFQGVDRTGNSCSAC